MQRLDARVRQIGAFGVISVATTLLDFGLFNILVLDDRVEPTIANIISYSTGIVASYYLNKMWTFRGGGRNRRSHEFGLFVLINFVGLGLSSVGVSIATNLGANTLVLNLVKLITGIATWTMKFVLFKRWVYPLRPTPLQKGTVSGD